MVKRIRGTSHEVRDSECSAESCFWSVWVNLYKQPPNLAYFQFSIQYDLRTTRTMQMQMVHSIAYRDENATGFVLAKYTKTGSCQLTGSQKDTFQSFRRAANSFGPGDCLLTKTHALPNIIDLWRNLWYTKWSQAMSILLSLDMRFSDKVRLMS